MFESLVSGMELSGMGKSDRDLLLGYLALIPPAHRPGVLKDRRAYPLSDGAMSVPRSVETWREAHRVLVKLEEADTGSKALVAAVGPGLVGAVNGSPSGGAAESGRRMTEPGPRWLP